MLITCFNKIAGLFQYTPAVLTYIYVWNWDIFRPSPISLLHHNSKFSKISFGFDFRMAWTHLVLSFSKIGQNLKIKIFDDNHPWATKNIFFPENYSRFDFSMLKKILFPNFIKIGKNFKIVFFDDYQLWPVTRR